MSVLDHIEHALGIAAQLTFAGAGVLAAYATAATAWPQRHRILAALRGEPISPVASVEPLSTAIPQQRDVEAVALPTRMPARASLARDLAGEG